MGKPKIRFKGYVEDWEQRKVTELGEVYIGLVTTMTAHYTNEGTLLIRNSDIKDGKFEFDTEPIYLDKEFAEQNKSRMHKVGDVITVHTGDVGTSAVITENEANSIGFATIVTRPNQKLLDSYYLSTFLNTEKHKAWAVQMSTGDGRTNYNLRDYTELVVPVPKLEEQKKIASYISSLNNLITLHQRKCEETKILKKYMLQKMFPQNGKKVPEIRFSGYTEDWEQRKLGEIYGSIGNAFVGTATPYYVEQGHFYLESNNVKDGQINHNSEIFINDEFYEKQKDKWLHTGDVVMVQSGHVGHAAVIPKELNNTAAHALIMFRNPKEEIEPYFLNYEYQTDKVKKKIENITTGNTIKHILASDMQEFVVDVPKYEEQKVIASYFSHLDHLITLHQHKCEELRKIKKYMLQNMFV
ncbi:MAG: restriction endonuclease subunit S [Roseburia sp.]|nr:restriction endonuclease subunit S [Roseburia sp.]